MAINPYMMATGAGLGALGGFLSPDQSSAYNQYADTLNQLAQAYNPYVNIGEGGLKGGAALTGLNALFPTLPENRMAASFQMSPYQQQMQQNLMNQMNANAATTGMLGSTAQDAALQNALASQYNQMQQQYINRGTNQYNQAINNMYRLAGMGMQGLGRQTGLEQEAALGSLRSDLSQQPWQQTLTGALGGAIGFM